MDPWRTSSLVLVLMLAGCTKAFYRKSADKETAAVIAGKTRAVHNMDPAFTIEPGVPVVLTNLPVAMESQAFFGANTNAEVGARVLSLEVALETAIRQSRTYQNRKELLYLQALGLTLERYRYTPIFSSGVGARYARTTTEIKDGVDEVVEEQSVGVDGDARVDMLLRTGTRLSAAFSADFLRFITGDPRVTTSSTLAGTLAQPLLRGAGYKIAVERLTQAERDLLYAMRDFARYRKEFAVEIAAAYYGVLQNRDAVRNSWRGFQDFKANVERELAFAREGLRPQASLDQLRQAELTTETRWINALRAYRQSLDQFKILIGLPTDVSLILEDEELRNLRIVHPAVSVEEAVQVALKTRLDLDTQRDRLEDAQRHIEVAANSLLPQLDLVANAGVDGTAGNRFPYPDFERYHWNAGVDLELPFDRKAERNAYRSALIAKARADRELTLAVDTIKLQIVEGWRNLDQAKRNYEISELGVQLSSRRVEEQELRAELGRGTARDLVDAQNDLINSQNERTAALVSHTIARLRFWRDMGILFIRPDGQWNEISDQNLK